MKRSILYCCTAVLLLITNSVLAQQQSGKKSQVKIDFADELVNTVQQGNKTFQTFRGHVELRQDSIFMYCDSAIIEDNIFVTAMGNVVIQQGDTTSAFADSLKYRGDTKQAALFGNVSLVNGSQKLFTNQLDYDLNTKTATYFTGATMTNNTTQLSSKRGYYYVKNDEIYFRDSVVVIDPEFSLRSDTLKFNTKSKTVFFLGPTLIKTDTSQIYCEAGYYDTQNETAEFRKNAQYKRGEQQAVADTMNYDGRKKEYDLKGNARFTDKNQDAAADHIRYEQNKDKYYLTGSASYRDSTRNIVAEEIIYDRKNELYSTKGRSRISDPPQILEADAVAYAQGNGTGVATGNVIWQDTSSNLTILAEKADYNRATNYLKATGGKQGRPLMITKVENDSLFLSSDTLLATQMIDTLNKDTIRMLFAYYRVRIYKNNLQAVCDSLSYIASDSTFRLYKDPIVWSDTSQFIADTVHILLKNNRIDRVLLRNNAFILNSPDEIFFNQIKGRDITAFFDSTELRRMDVQGNAEAVYYARDDKGGYVGVNKTVASEMLLNFGDNQIDNIRFYEQPKSDLLPMKQADHETLKLRGFRWETRLRPRSPEDVLTAFERIQPPSLNIKKR